MGDGLKRLCKRHGGLTVTSGGKTAKFTATGREKKSWLCACGDHNYGKKCPKCGKTKEQSNEYLVGSMLWTGNTKDGTP